MSEDINPDVIKKTQKILGKYVKKPPLTEKLLRKPPFRFLHDVVNTVISETGYLKGLYSQEELKAENVKEKDAKVAFLNKLIDAVKVTTKTNLAVRSNKIVAGLEPTNTNLLLQAIGKALDAKIDASAYITQLNSGKINATEKKKVKKNSSNDDKVKSTSKTKLVKDEAKTTKSKKIANESPRSKAKESTPKDSSRNKNKDKTSVKKETKSKVTEKQESPKAKEETIAEPINAQVIQNEVENVGAGNINDQNNIVKMEPSNNEILKSAKEEKSDNEPGETANDLSKPEALTEKNEKKTHLGQISTENQENIQTENSQNEDGKTSTQSLKRPKSARPKSGDRRITSSRQKMEKVHREEILKPLEMTMNQPSQPPKTSLRPPSVRPSSARPGAPRLRPDSALPLQEPIAMGTINVIIENVDNVDDEETVVIQTSSEVADEPGVSLEVPQENKGQLVEQILEQIQEEGDGVKKKVDIDWEEDVLHNKDGVFKEVNQLKSLIQTLTKTANPLGKLMNYLHEDIDAMHGELQMWTNIKKQLFSEIQKQKRLSTESNKPLLAHLQHLQEEIRKQEQEIINVRSNILRNELRIKELSNI